MRDHLLLGREMSYNMAPHNREKVGNPALDENNEDEDDQRNIWSTILKEVQSSSNTKLSTKKTLLVLGPNESGKTTLVAKIKGAGDPKKGAGMEYFYIDVKDDYRDDQTRLGVHILDGEPTHSHLLKIALSETNFEHVTVLICASMTQPWNIMDSLTTWANILTDHVDNLRTPSEQKKEWKQKVIKRWQDYVEPVDELDTAASQLRRNTVFSGSVDEESSSLPLPEGVLTVNLGLDIVVVITKTDFMSNLEKEQDYRDEHFDFIQQSVRKFCLQYGASLFYTSVKEFKNCNLLYKYLVHRIYGFPFHTPASVVDKDAVFIPSGWDNEKKISILYENMSSMGSEDLYSDVIVKPVVRRLVQRDVEIQAEDDQVFLTKQQSLLNQQSPNPSQRQDEKSPNRGAFSAPRTPDRRLTESPVQPGSGGPTKKVDGTKGGSGTNEGVLANFFNSLLNKGAKSPQGTAKLTDKAGVRSDAVVELDRMTRPKKASLNSGSSSPNSFSPPPS